MMIGGEFNTPADWLRAGNAVKTIDDFAAAHGGNAPVFVFVDSGGAFNNDTECVNGTRGNAADHLTKDVVPFMISNFGVSAEPAQLGRRRLVDGRHLRRRPDRHASRHVQHVRRHRRRPGARTRAPRRRPSPGCSAATPPRGRRSTRRRSSPDTAATPGCRAGSTVIEQPAEASSRSVGDRRRRRRASTAATPPPTPTTRPRRRTRCARLGRANGINCAVVAQPGKHDWPFAAHAFAAALPWLAGQLDTPGVPRIATPIQLAARIGPGSAAAQPVGPRPDAHRPPGADRRSRFRAYGEAMGDDATEEPVLRARHRTRRGV